ncbi:MAG: hypothetical protein PHR15_05550 [Atopobiaceae bacterium]|jgi:hypothetical protein|nr:hypothetical protein [Atopobiaceae bacterium]MDD4380927.1 hypothetical protein [Atopobiaceae bacterium]
MEWVYQDAVVETVDWFVRRAIPDSSDWRGESYRIQQVAMIGGSAWRVEVDIPTSAEDAWLSFIIEASDETGETSVTDIECVRGGRGENVGRTYNWDDCSCEWRAVDSSDGEGGSL